MINKQYLDSDLISESIRPLTVEQLLERLELQSNHLSLGTKFKRNDNIWSDVTKSRFIESTLIQLSLPCFYIDATNNDQWFMIDGLQRLLAFKEFLVDRTLTLTGLEFCEECDQMKCTEMPNYLRRRIRDTELRCHLYLSGTSSSVIPCLYRRINSKRYTFGI